MRLLHFEVSPGLRNDSIVTLAYLWPGGGGTLGISGWGCAAETLEPLTYNCLKTIPFTAAHTYIAHIRQCPPPRTCGKASGRPAESVVWEITPLTSDHYPMINYPAKLVLCTAKLSTNFSCWPCVCFVELMEPIIWLLTGRVGWWVFWLCKIILLLSLLLWWDFFLIFRCKYKTINSRQSLSLFQVFLQNTYLPFFFSQITQSPTAPPRKSNGLTLVTQ